MKNHDNHRPHRSKTPRPKPPGQTPATVRRDQILADCGTLRIPITAEQLDSVLAEAEKAGWSHLDFLQHLLADQAGQRRARAIARRVKDANFRALKPLSAFDWQFNPTIPRTQIETLAQCDFIRRQQNVVFVGQSGVGKTHLIQSIGEAACIRGFRVHCITSGALVEDLNAALADQTIQQRIRHYTRYDLLIIDEFGFDKLERTMYPHATSMWYKIIDARDQRASTALVTNIDFGKWDKYLDDEHLAMAMLDRVVHGATIVKLVGKSYRIHGAAPQ